MMTIISDNYHDLCNRFAGKTLPHKFPAGYKVGTHWRSHRFGRLPADTALSTIRNVYYAVFVVSDEYGVCELCTIGPQRLHIKPSGVAHIAFQTNAIRKDIVVVAIDMSRYEDLHVRDAVRAMHEILVEHVTKGAEP